MPLMYERLQEIKKTKINTYIEMTCKQIGYNKLKKKDSNKHMRKIKPC